MQNKKTKSIEKAKQRRKFKRVKEKLAGNSDKKYSKKPKNPNSSKDLKSPRSFKNPTYKKTHRDSGSSQNSNFSTSSNEGKLTQKKTYKNSKYNDLRKPNQSTNSKKSDEQEETVGEYKFPMRINKFLAMNNLSTRRGADKLISTGKVTVNGDRAELGMRVNEGDKVEIENYKPKNHRYFAYYKPAGIVTHSAQNKQEDIRSKVKDRNLFPIGRLDRDSHGLIIMTDDGRVTDRLLNPKYIHEKEYVVFTKKKINENFKNKMESGVRIEDERTKPCKVRLLSDRSFSIILTEGKKHQIKRMVVAMFNEVIDLKRTRIMNIQVGKMKPNQLRKLEGPELERFLTDLNLV